MMMIIIIIIITRLGETLLKYDQSPNKAGNHGRTKNEQTEFGKKADEAWKIVTGSRTTNRRHQLLWRKMNEAKNRRG